jgi:hypothetical protein
MLSAVCAPSRYHLRPEFPCGTSRVTWHRPGQFVAFSPATMGPESEVGETRVEGRDGGGVVVAAGAMLMAWEEKEGGRAGEARKAWTRAMAREAFVR